jgi:hypothetical protein
MPPALVNEPVLGADELNLLMAYRVIARERPSGYKYIAGITMASIERYLNFWPEYDPPLFAELMLMIDDEWRGPENETISRKG